MRITLSQKHLAVLVKLLSSESTRSNSESKEVLDRIKAQICQRGLAYWHNILILSKVENF